MQDTLSQLAQNDTVQQIAVVLQGLLLALGALFTLFQRKK